MSVTTDPRAEEWSRHESKYLAQAKCPHTGERLSLIRDDQGRDSLCCWACDCFGFDPNDTRVSPDRCIPRLKHHVDPHLGCVLR